MRVNIPFLTVAAMLAGSAPAFAVGDPNNPDWPCVQKKVLDLSPTAIWDGPALDAHKDWFQDKELSTVVKKLATRRVPIEKAVAALETYIKAQPEADRDAKLTKAFAGLFSTVNTQRRSVISGIEKFQRAQKERAKELEQQGVDIAKLQGDIVVDDTAAVPPSPEEEKLYWAGRIFQERQANIPIACELPATIEERLFELARTIRGMMSK
ncbi:MAG: hypothetical protein NW216_13525 [Hyphomicrobium sp.]|nr:hypothetical protein [Hyphomicrobium sp.]